MLNNYLALVIQQEQRKSLIRALKINNNVYVSNYFCRNVLPEQI